MIVFSKLTNHLMGRCSGCPHQYSDEQTFSYELGVPASGIGAKTLNSHVWHKPTYATPKHGEYRANPLDRLTWMALNFAAHCFAKLWPQASGNLLHYLRNTGEPLTQDVNQLLEDIREFRLRLNDHQLTIGDSAVNRCVGQNLEDAATFGFSSRWMKFTHTEYRHLGWFLALGDWEYRLDGWVIVQPTEANRVMRYIVVTWVHLRDRYDWDCPPATKIGLLSIPHFIPARLHRVGMAKEFIMYGQSIVVMTGSRGTRVIDTRQVHPASIEPPASPPHPPA